MSEQTKENSDDKKDIEMEEREQIMNAENIAKDSSDEIQTNKEVTKLNKTEIKEGREVKPKKIPIGGIQMPGFFTRSRSKEKCKDSDGENTGTDAEGTELLESKKDESSDADEKQQRIKLPNPFGKKIKTEDNGEDSEPTDQSQHRLSIIDTFRIPLVSVFSRKNKANPDLSLGAQTDGGVAGLASMETLDDNEKTDDLKNVTLESNDKDKTDPEKQEFKDPSLRTKLRAYRVVISAVLMFLLILIVIIALIVPGKTNVAVPIKDGRFVETVTSCGLVEGMLEDGAFAFRGIPYALSPTYENRWKPAHPLDNLGYCWNGTFLAHNATPACSQLYANGTVNGVEDCLTLDVITPYVRYDTPLPVVVMIGSESLMGGSPAKMRPSLRYARSRDVLFVRPNFRVGVLGFLSAEVLSNSVHPPTSGNYGLTDIIEALRWVQLNIQHFGGDPKQVTLFGHRAGATLVTVLTSSKMAKGLFARAWASSGGAIFPGNALAESEAANAAYLSMTSCETADCLRKQEVNDLIDAVLDTWRKPSPDLPKPIEADFSKRHDWLVVDGHILKTHPVDFWTKEDNDPVQLVLGTTAHAASSDLLYLRHTTWTPELIKAHIQESVLGTLNLTEEVLSYYPASYQGLVALISDIRTVCPLLTVSVQKQYTPFYVVTQVRGELNIADVDSDIDAILGRYEPKSPEQRRYVAAMQQLFYHYVWHGEVLQTEKKPNQILIIEQDVNPAKDYTHCDFWIKKNIVPKYAQLD